MQQFRQVSRTRTTYSVETHTNDVLKWEASAVFPGEVLSAGGGVPRERVLQQSFEFFCVERLDDRIRCTHEETIAVVKP